jgi:hypothetical protein
MRVPDSYREGAVLSATERLVRWAAARGFADGQWLGYMWDNPEITAHQNCRYDIGVEVPDLIAEGEVGRIDFPAMQVAEIQMRGAIDLELRAMDGYLVRGSRRAGLSRRNSLDLRHSMGGRLRTAQSISSCAFSCRLSGADPGQKH